MGIVLMKIAHIADAHIGLGYPGPSPLSRFDDIVRALDFAADIMIAEHVDICLFAGDAFKDSKVMLDRASVEIAAFYSWLQKLSSAAINTVIISGTPSHDAVQAYELLKKMRLSNVKIFTAPGIDSSFGINVIAIPGVGRSNIMTGDECRDMTPQEVHGVMSRKITGIAQGLLAQVNNDSPSVLLSHLTHSEADTEFDRMRMDNEPLLTYEATQGFDLVALGHIHKAQRITGKNIFYSGSIDRLGFGEADYTPGFWIHEIDGGKNISSRFIETPARRHVTIRDDLIAKTDVKDAVVKLSLHADEETAKLIDRKQIEKDLYENGAFFVQEIKIELERSEWVRDKDVTESLGPIEALCKWGEQQNIEAAEVAELSAMTSELLEESA
jgi:exonuclease SbcD